MNWYTVKYTQPQSSVVIGWLASEYISLEEQNKWDLVVSHQISFKRISLSKCIRFFRYKTFE